jgi:hypothetical protein
MISRRLDRQAASCLVVSVLHTSFVVLLGAAIGLGWELTTDALSGAFSAGLARGACGKLKRERYGVLRKHSKVK